MLNWLRKKTEVERLKERYRKLMKKAFRTALNDQVESEKIHKEAKVIYDRIKEYDSRKEAS